LRQQASGALAPALGLGLICSLAAALPASARSLAAGLPATAVVTLWASVSLVVLPLALWLRWGGAARLGASERALLAGAALSALPLALFGGVLKSTTHHRPLGGATFAVVALGVLALCIGLSLRVLRRSGSTAVKSAWQKLFTLACGLSLAGTLLLGAAGVARPSLVDFLAMMTAAILAGVLKIPSWLSWVKALAGLGGWAVLLVCGVLASTDPQLPRSLTTQAPVSFAALSWLGVGS
jgi:hypothetical protein